MIFFNELIEFNKIIMFGAYINRTDQIVKRVHQSDYLNVAAAAAARPTVGPETLMDVGRRYRFPSRTVRFPDVVDDVARVR